MVKKCKHEWRFLERWFGEKNTEYIFYCSKCLEVTNQQIDLVRKKS